MVVQNWYIFNENEKKILRDSWSILSIDLKGFGILIYEMIFKQCPESKLLFPFMKFKVDGQEKKSDEFGFQALRFVQILETAIQYLDDLSATDSLLDNLGKLHGRLESSIGFKQHYWTVFRECALYNIRKVLERNKKKQMSPKQVDNAVIFWRLLFDGIIERIEHGYEKDLLNRASSIDDRVEPNNPRKIPSDSGSMDSNAASSSHRGSNDLSAIISNLNPFKQKKSVDENRSDLTTE
ncbi:GLOBIN domain-containing protein [Aphelenchoides besseyi]|nr:GLOBIN domain-containing protein [Aphelenchoides besseyi]KAI6200392.1 GLOBIN domain-containing protein [Aphelenchoides besseyi]